MSTKNTVLNAFCSIKIASKNLDGFICGEQEWATKTVRCVSPSPSALDFRDGKNSLFVGKWNESIQFYVTNVNENALFICCFDRDPYTPNCKEILSQMTAEKIRVNISIFLDCIGRMMVCLSDLLEEMKHLPKGCPLNKAYKLRGDHSERNPVANPIVPTLYLKVDYHSFEQ